MHSRIRTITVAPGIHGTTGVGLITATIGIIITTTIELRSLGGTR
jgi:hypothetical protein